MIGTLSVPTNSHNLCICVLYRVAACCSVLQRVAVCCSVLQCDAVLMTHPQLRMLKVPTDSRNFLSCALFVFCDLLHSESERMSVTV